MLNYSLNIHKLFTQYTIHSLNLHTIDSFNIQSNHSIYNLFT